MMVNPGSILQNYLDALAWPWALTASGLAFTLFFLQTGMDLNRAGKMSDGGVVGLALEGAVLGTIGVAVLGVVAWVLSRPFSGKQSVGWAVRAFGLGYSPTLVYALCGLAANLFWGWNTALAFGVTGLLWALGPMFAAVREMSGGRNGVSVVLSTVCGGAMLFAWAMLTTGG